MPTLLYIVIWGISLGLVYLLGWYSGRHAIQDQYNEEARAAYLTDEEA